MQPPFYKGQFYEWPTGGCLRQVHCTIRRKLLSSCHLQLLFGTTYTCLVLTIGGGAVAWACIALQHCQCSVCDSRARVVWEGGWAQCTVSSGIHTHMTRPAMVSPVLRNTPAGVRTSWGEWTTMLQCPVNSLRPVSPSPSAHNDPPVMCSCMHIFCLNMHLTLTSRSCSTVG